MRRDLTIEFFSTLEAYQDQYVSQAANRVAVRLAESMQRDFREVRKEVRAALHGELVWEEYQKVLAEYDKAGTRLRAIDAIAGHHHGYTIRRGITHFEISGPYNPDLIARLKKIDGRWNGAEWRVPTRRLAAMQKLLKDLPDLVELQRKRDDAQRAEREKEERRKEEERWRQRQESDTRAREREKDYVLQEQLRYLERKEAAAKRRAEKRAAEDAKVGRIYWHEIAGAAGYAGDYYTRDDKLYIVEGYRIQKEYEDGDDVAIFSGIPATPEQEAEYHTKVAAERERRRAAGVIDGWLRQVTREGEYPAKGTFEIKGDIVYDTHNGYGAGERIVIGTDWIWSVQNHSMDGDDWSHNNVSGCIARRVPFDAELADKLRAAAATLNGGNQQSIY